MPLHLFAILESPYWPKEIKCASDILPNVMDGIFMYDNMTESLQHKRSETLPIRKSCSRMPGEDEERYPISGYRSTSSGDEGSPYWVYKNNHAVLVAIYIGYNDKLRNVKDNAPMEMVQTSKQCNMLSLKITPTIVKWIKTNMKEPIEV